MNAFQMLRPRGADAPAKPPTKRKKPTPITTKGTTRVLNAAGKWQAYLEPARHSIVIEGREAGQASNDKRQRINKSGVM